MKKSVLIVIACALSVFAFQAFTTSHQPKWKNLHVLPNNISQDDLDSVMHHFTASLGVKCNYCHVKNTETNKMEFAKDDKPEKLIARKMMLMSLDINKNHFVNIEEQLHDKDGKIVADNINGQDSVQYMLKYVTCYTCHHGNAHPENKPPKQNEGPRPPEPPKDK